jgi:hypothetical protein
VLLGGGATVTNNDGHPDWTVLIESRPLDSTSWQAVGVVTTGLGGHMAVQARAICSV